MSAQKPPRVAIIGVWLESNRQAPVAKEADFKSFYQLEGADILGHKTHLHPDAQIGVLVGDRRWQSHRQWLDIAGVADHPRVRHYSIRDDDSFEWNDLRFWPKVATAFAKAVDQLQLSPGSILITDPMPIWIPGKVNDYKDVAIGIAQMDRVIKTRALSLHGIFHQGKQIADKTQQYKRPQDKILGSAAQIGYTDTAMYLSGPDELDTPYYGFGAVPHNALPEVWKFTRDAWGMFVPYTEAEDFDAIETVMQQVPTDPYGASVGQVLHQLETSQVTISRASVYICLKKLVTEGRLVQPKRGQYVRRPTS